MGRSPCCDKSKVKRGIWSPQEDATLKAYLLNNGTGGNWITLPQKAGLSRCGKSCRLRWLNYLRPDIKHGPFTEEEDDIIINMYNKIGSRWSTIASHLIGRTDNDVKNHWNTKLRKKLIALNSQQHTSLEKSATFQASKDLPISSSPNFALQFPVSTSMNCNNMSVSYDQAMNFHSPRLVYELPDSIQDFDFSSFPSSWMNEVKSDTPNEDFSVDFTSVIDGYGGDGDLFSL